MMVIMCCFFVRIATYLMSFLLLWLFIILARPRTHSQGPREVELCPLCYVFILNHRMRIDGTKKGHVAVEEGVWCRFSDVSPLLSSNSWSPTFSIIISCMKRSFSVSVPALEVPWNTGGCTNSSTM